MISITTKRKQSLLKIFFLYNHIYLGVDWIHLALDKD